MSQAAKKKPGLFGLLVSPIPFGVHTTKPRHFREMFRIVWENRSNLRYAWKVLSKGTCDGCALGTTGLKDWTIDGTHLCLVRLNLLRLNTMPALDGAKIEDAEALGALGSRGMRELGRIPFPMRRRRGERGFTRVSWEEVWSDVGERWRQLEPDRTAMYVTSRGITNEVYYTAQKVMRLLGTNNVDNSARLCHSPSSVALKATIGAAATTCSYKDWWDADLIVFLGSNPANDQPVAVKYLLEARKGGTRSVMVNAYREPGMARYWIPSNAGSAVFGSKLTDRFYMVKIGGDLAFLNAVQKLLIEDGHTHTEFIEAATVGYPELQAELATQPLDELLEIAGVTRADAQAFADEVAGAERAIFVWSMGITQHKHGSDTVRAICNLGLLREAVGRDGTGLMPIRGHSGVQGGAEMGAYSNVFPGGVPIDADSAKHFGELWNMPLRDEPGLTTVEALEASMRGEIDAYHIIGGNFLETMPQPERIEAGLAKIGLRIHSDIVMTSQMLVEPADVVYVLPAATRYEQKDGGTETSTERRVIYSPEIPRKDLPGVRSEWELLLDLARAVRPDADEVLGLSSGAAIRADIERAVPFYKGIAKLEKQGDQFQYGGRHLCAERKFMTPDGKAHFVPVRPPQLGGSNERAANEFVLATRRGKQFNSMVQKDWDQLTGAERDHIFISAADARGLGLTQDQPIRLQSEVGEFLGRTFIADVTEGTLQGFWPEVNVLISAGRVDRGGGAPDYNARVTLEAAGAR